ncbi:MAG: 50S ribosomal protein L4 [Candidatus Aenigmarchaeota archaeon]|nr:50S ribosomal protein L4 [Candidatus Aenigmarchaeota archaeon]
MKAQMFDVAGNKAGEVELPAFFETPYRPDVIRRAVLVQQSKSRQRYGSDPLAGKRTSAHYHGSRHYRFTMMNKEMSRIPRIHGKGAGMYAMRARFAPHAVKGRRAHPPKAEKIWARDVNQKEKLLAIRSALAAAAQLELVTKRGHATAFAPVILVDEFENLAKTKDVLAAFAKIIPKELVRCAKKKVRAGRGKMRGRRYKKRTGPLVIASANCKMIKAARNIQGVDAVSAANINAELLAPGTDAGRLVIATKSALGKLEEKFGE